MFVKHSLLDIKERSKGKPRSDVPNIFLYTFNGQLILLQVILASFDGLPVAPGRSRSSSRLR